MEARSRAHGSPGARNTPHGAAWRWIAVVTLALAAWLASPPAGTSIEGARAEMVLSDDADVRQLARAHDRDGRLGHRRAEWLALALAALLAGWAGFAGAGRLLAPPGLRATPQG